MANQDISTAKPFENKHVKFMDVNNDGLLEEIAVVKQWDDGSFSYVLVTALSNLNKGRLKALVTSQHADKYQLWEIMSQSKLSNGLNALDFFHNNFVKIFRPQGSLATSMGGGLATASIVSNRPIGQEFTDPASAVPDGANISTQQ